MNAVAHFHFKLNNLYVDAKLLGTKNLLERDGCKIIITFPEILFDFGLDEKFSEPALSVWKKDKDNNWIAVAVNLVRVSVELEIPDEAGVERPDRSTVEEVTKLLRGAAASAKQFTRDYINFIRTCQDQHWLAHSAQELRVTFHTSVFNKDTGQRIPIGYRDPLVGTITSDKHIISLEKHTKIIEALERNDQVDLSDTLLCDAKYLAWSSEPRQHREAILMAAVAVEVKIKEVLDIMCPSIAKPLLEFTLNNPRDVSFQAVSLYDKVAEAIIGRSLRNEKKEVYKALQQLFENRNAVAHRASTIDKNIIRSNLEAAEEALRWANSLIEEKNN